MDNILWKKHFNFSSSNNDRKYYEEFLAPKITYKDQILDCLIPTHAPASNGSLINTEPPTNSYLPKNFTLLDDNCPPGYTNWQPIPYNLNSFVFYFGRFFRSNQVTLATDIPGLSNKWQQKIPESNLRKRYKITLEAVPISSETTINPLPIQSTIPQAYINKTIIAGKAPVKVNPFLAPDNLKSIIMSGNPIIETAEILPGFLIQYVSGTENFGLVSVKYCDYTINFPDITIYLNEQLNNPLTGNETYNIIPMFHNSPNYLKNIVDHTFDAPYYTYMHYIEKTNGNEIPFGVSDYVIDKDIGMITFYDGIPSNVDSLNPIKISFYQAIPNLENINNKEDDKIIKNLLNMPVEITETTSNGLQSIANFTIDSYKLQLDLPNKNINLPLIYPNKKTNQYINVNFTLNFIPSANQTVFIDIFAIDYDAILTTKTIIFSNLSTQNKISDTISILKQDIVNLINTNNNNLLNNKNSSINSNTNYDILLEIRAYKLNSDIVEIII